MLWLTAIYRRHRVSGGGLGFRANVISGVLSTLIAAILTWLFGFWPAIWLWVVAFAGEVWRWITFTAPIPLSFIVVLVCAAAFAIARRPSARIPSGSGVEQQPRYTSRVVPTGECLPKTEEAPPKLVLSANETSIVRLLAEADGKWLGIEDFVTKTGNSRLVTEKTLEMLFGKSFLVNSHNYLHGTSFRLSSTGRDYAIELGFVR